MSNIRISSMFSSFDIFISSKKNFLPLVLEMEGKKFLFFLFTRASDNEEEDSSRGTKLAKVMCLRLTGLFELKARFIAKSQLTASDSLVTTASLKRSMFMI